MGLDKHVIQEGMNEKIANTIPNKLNNKLILNTSLRNSKMLSSFHKFDIEEMNSRRLLYLLEKDSCRSRHLVVVKDINP